MKHASTLSPENLNDSQTVDGDRALALYIHWPFCVSKCPYCDFNSHVRDTIDLDAWREALLADLAHEAALVGRRPLVSIFFGGGTPSLMPPALVADLIAAAERHFGFPPDIEITLEANPSSVEAARFSDLALAGVNRVSLGVQALDDAALRFLGRAHDVGEALAALETAQSAFDRVSFDLIYARPEQTPEAWRSELERALSFGTGHMSLYQLTVEPGTRFETLARRGTLIPADEDSAADLYALTGETMAGAGLPAYEVSNHARPGQESRHNLVYWRYGDYLGVGPGAHGRRAGLATQRHKKPENFLSGVARNGHGLSSEEPLSVETRSTEALMMGLRLAEGVDLEGLGARLGRSPGQLVDLRACERLQAMDLVTLNGSRLSVRPDAMILLDAILPELIATSPAD